MTVRSVLSGKAAFGTLLDEVLLFYFLEEQFLTLRTLAR